MQTENNLVSLQTHYYRYNLLYVENNMLTGMLRNWDIYTLSEGM
jgi:hypothetical protein